MCVHFQYTYGKCMYFLLNNLIVVFDAVERIIVRMYVYTSTAAFLYFYPICDQSNIEYSTVTRNYFEHILKICLKLEYHCESKSNMRWSIKLWRWSSPTEMTIFFYPKLTLLGLNKLQAMISMQSWDKLLQCGSTLYLESIIHYSHTIYYPHL